MQNQNKIGVSLPGWMNERGLRRSFFGGSTCPTCGEVRVKTYYRHPFPLPPPLTKGHWLVSDCLCVRKELAEKRLKQQNLLTQAYTQGRVDPIPLALREHSFDNFQVTASNRKPYQDCQNFMQRFPQHTQGNGILLMGPSGTGKTHLACSIANGLKGTHSVAFACFPILLEKMRTGFANIDELLSADLLVLDDVGSVRETAWTTERMLLIVDGRLTNSKPTVFTSNYELDDFEARVGMRVASRIIGTSLHVFLRGADWRLYRNGKKRY